MNIDQISYECYDDAINEGVAMNPLFLKPLFDLFGLPYLGAYMSTLFVAFTLGSLLSIAVSPLLGGKRWSTTLLALVAIPSALLGSKLFHILFDEHFLEYMNTLGEKGPLYLFTLFHPFSGGHVFYGGLVGGAIGGVTLMWYLTGRRVSELWRYADITSFAIVAGLAIARIGCLTEGCCFGRPFLYGMQFPALSKTAFMLHRVLPAYDFTQPTLPLFPTQITHSIVNFIILIYLLYHVVKSKKPLGWFVLSAISYYAVGRFFIEFFRFDVRGNFLILSTSQWISIALFIWAYPKLHRLAKKTNQQKS